MFTILLIRTLFLHGILHPLPPRLPLVSVAPAASPALGPLLSILRTPDSALGGAQGLHCTPQWVYRVLGILYSSYEHTGLTPRT